MKNKFLKWFNLNLGWFFNNGQKQGKWKKYLENKYQKDKLYPGPTKF